MAQQHHPRIIAYSTRAADLGSTATTLRGAGKYLLARVKSPLSTQDERFAGTSPRWTWYSESLTPRQWRDTFHAMRLAARFAGRKRLPAYLTPADRSLIANHPITKDILRFRAVPVYARAWYVTPAMRQVPRLAREIQGAESERGALTDSYLVARDAERRHDWGRLSVHEPGECVEPGFVGIRESGSNTNWNKKSTLRRRVNYCLIYPSRRRGVWSGYYVDADRRAHRVYCTDHYLQIDHAQPMSIAPKRPTAQPLPVHIQRRILEMATPAVLSVQYDRERKMLMLVDSTGEQYHIDGFGAGERCAEYSAITRRIVKDAVTAFRKRRSEKIEVARLRSPRLYVELEDSYAAGNCVPLSDQFARQMWQQIGAIGPCAVRADLILSAREDSYTRRACAYAASRTPQEMVA